MKPVRAPLRRASWIASITAVVMPECEKPMAMSPSPSSDADISIICESSKMLALTPIRKLWLAWKTYVRG